MSRILVTGGVLQEHTSMMLCQHLHYQTEDMLLYYCQDLVGICPLFDCDSGVFLRKRDMLLWSNLGPCAIT